MLGIESDTGVLEKCHLSIVKHDDKASLAKYYCYKIVDYCSISPGCYKSPPLQEFSSRELGGSREKIRVFFAKAIFALPSGLIFRMI